MKSGRLRKNNWSLTLPLAEARLNEELVSLADSQVLRWINELRGMEDADEQAKAVWQEIRQLRKRKYEPGSRKEMRRLYNELDRLQYKPDYMCLVIENNRDYRRACKGFSINGITYKRLLGTAGGLKNSTVVFISEELRDEICRRIDNGRDPNKEMVVAKLEAYKALACSASTPVSFPHGLLVVPDVETTFKDDIIYLTDEFDGEPFMELRKDQQITIDASDGCGLMLPSLAERWSEELNLGYTMSACNTRQSFEKGMVFTFDFIEFAEKVAGKYMVTDAWGCSRDIRDVELILTTSQLKLWDSYDSLEDYLANCEANHYTFAITKTAPKELESERSLNYQFIQPLDLDDDDIEELIEPTMTEIHEALGGDWSKSVLFMEGLGITDENVEYATSFLSQAIMANHEVVNDPYIQSFIYGAIKNRIQEAKVGVLKVHGNYSIVSGDPYALCQSIFGLEVTGLLKAGEVYNRYWLDVGVDRAACFRAPMSCVNSIRLVDICNREDAQHWYQYISTCTILNSWDTVTMALNGMDFDGDIVLLTDCRPIVENVPDTPALSCVQRKAKKVVPTEEDFIQSNIESFGNCIGQVTNRITSQYELRSRYPVDSEEYKILSYRIQCGQLFQQNEIDKIKGIVSKPMPRSWYDGYGLKEIRDEEKQELYRRILADKRPYFMGFVYPGIHHDYLEYIADTDRSATKEFGKSVAELQATPREDLTEKEVNFLFYYDRFMPVGNSDCVINKICHRFEKEFDKYLRDQKETAGFDYMILKTDTECPPFILEELKRLYKEYNRRVREYKIFSEYERVSDEESVSQTNMLRSSFIRDCEKTCPNREMLCNALLDICYSKSATKRFVWSMCGRDIVDNLLQENGWIIQYPVLDDNGEFDYRGNRYTIKTKTYMEDE